MTFPISTRCDRCRAPALMYPNVTPGDPRVVGGPRPTLVCPSCSSAGMEQRVRAGVVRAGRHALNGRTVFEAAA